MKKNLIFILSFVLLAIGACSDDDNNTTNSVSVAFSVPSINLTENTTPIQVLFSSPTAESGNLTITYVANSVAYGTDFSTLPAATENTIVVPFAANVSSTSFSFNKIINAIEGQVKNVVFTISNVSLGNSNITGNTTIQVNFNETASLGTSLAAEVGGPSQPNQVYIDLSSGSKTSVPRVSWDLGFYSGTEFRVALNNSVKMSVKKLETTNIDEVQVEDPSMIINTGQGNVNQVDAPAGNINETAMTAVSDNNDDNKVYIINMGSNPGTTPAVGSEASASGPHRGWKKVRILKSGNDYKIQYADLGATTHQEKTISKSAAFNFTFFSFVSNNVVPVEPQKNQWDLNFTSFISVVSMGGPPVPYNYPDFVVTNTKGGATSYQVLNSEGFTYDSFTRANVNESKFSTADQRNIGSNWRATSVVGPDGNPVSQFVVRLDRFFIVKDAAGNIYKLKFTSALSPTGERGFPIFQYALLQ